MGKGIFTRNYDNILTMARIPTIAKSSNNNPKVSVGSKFEDGHCVLKDKTGLIQNTVKMGESSTYGYNMAYPFGNIVSSVSSAPSGSGQTSIYLGSDNIEETYDDFTLSQELLIYSSAGNNYDLQYGIPTHSGTVYDEETECWKSTIHYVFVANRECTVGEMGFYFAGSPLLNQSKTYLIYRRAFEEAYKLNTGDTFVIDFTVVIPANPNKPITTEVETTVE